MALDGLASVQSRISAIQSKIESLSNNGRPPVALTESGTSGSSLSATNAAGEATAANTVKGLRGSGSSSAFASQLSSQVARANAASATTKSGVGTVQGVPGTAEAFVEKVRSYIGVPYVWGGTDPATGLDCSGMIQTAARQVGVTLPRVTWDQQNAGVEVERIEDAKPGDLILLRKSAHIAVYIGDGKVIHAPRPGKNVTEADLDELGPIVTIRRVMRSSDDAPANPALANPALTNPALSPATSADFNSPGASTQALLGALTGSHPTNLAASGLNQSATNPTQVANALVGALSGTGAATGTTGAALGGQGANTTLLNQFLESNATASAPASAPGLAALASNGTESGSLTSTAAALNRVSTLRNALGV